MLCLDHLENGHTLTSVMGFVRWLFGCFALSWKICGSQKDNQEASRWFDEIPDCPTLSDSIALWLWAQYFSASFCK